MDAHLISSAFIGSVTTSPSFTLINMHLDHRNMAIIACVSIAILSCWVIRWSKEDDVEHRFHSQRFGSSADVEKPCVEHIERLPSHHSNPTVV